MNLTSTTALDLDPLSHPHTNDPRISKYDANVNANANASKVSSSVSASYIVVDSCGKKRLYPYEPLPRTGLAHAFVQAIISPWLGPNAEQDDILLGLTTLRTWWQHRRKGESSSAKSALGTDKMRSVVEGYTRHFFNLAHCIIMNDGEQPPRTLANRIKELEKNGVMKKKKKKKEEEVDGIVGVGVGIAGAGAGAGAGAAVSISPRNHTNMNTNNTDDDDDDDDDNDQVLEEVGEEGDQDVVKKPQSCCSAAVVNVADGNGHGYDHGNSMEVIPAPKLYGDPNKTPVVFVSEGGDIQIAMVSSEYYV